MSGGGGGGGQKSHHLGAQSERIQHLKQVQRVTLRHRHLEVVHRVAAWKEADPSSHVSQPITVAVCPPTGHRLRSASQNKADVGFCG